MRILDDELPRTHYVAVTALADQAPVQVNIWLESLAERHGVVFDGDPLVVENYHGVAIESPIAQDFPFLYFARFQLAQVLVGMAICEGQILD